MDRAKFPASLATHVLQNKLDLFNVWLENNGDWGKTALTDERKTSCTRKFKKGRKGMKSRDIIALYGEEKLSFGLEAMVLFVFCIWEGLTLYFLRSPIEVSPNDMLCWPRKGKALMEKLRSREMFEEDEDFPKDEDETQHTIGIDSKNALKDTYVYTKQEYLQESTRVSTRIKS